MVIGSTNASQHQAPPGLGNRRHRPEESGRGGRSQDHEVEEPGDFSQVFRVDDRGLQRRVEVGGDDTDQESSAASRHSLEKTPIR